MDEADVSDSGARVVVKRFRRRSLTRLPLADSQDACASAAAQPTLDAPAVSAQDTSLHACPPQPGPASLLPLAAKSRPHVSQPQRDPQPQQSLRPPQFAPVRPFLRWGSQSLPASTLRPKLPPSTPLGGLPPPGPLGPSRSLGPYQPASSSGLPPPPLRPTPRSLVLPQCQPHFLSRPVLLCRSRRPSSIRLKHLASASQVCRLHPRLADFAPQHQECRPTLNAKTSGSFSFSSCIV